MAIKKINDFKIDTSSIRGSGENRHFVLSGDANAVFSIEVLNEDGHYYNFYTKLFSATKSTLDKAVLRNGKYRNSILFPKITDDDHYDILVYAEPVYETEHKNYIEARRQDGVIDVNNSSGSESLMLTKKLFQYVDVTLTLSAISVNDLTPFGSTSVAGQTIDLASRKPGGKIPFTIVATAAATRNFSINRQPLEKDIVAFAVRTIGAAAIPIQNEDTSSSTYYKWPIDNIIGLQEGMLVKRATNVTNGTSIRRYVSEFETEYRPTDEKTSSQQETIRQRNIRTQPTIQRSIYGSVSPERPAPVQEMRSIYGTDAAPTGSTPSEIQRSTYYQVYEEAIQPTGVITFTDDVPTSLAGNVVFSHQQADALKDDEVKIFGYGMQNIKSLTNYDLKFTDLKVELTLVTTTTTANTVGSSSTTVAITERAGIRDGASTVTGIGVDTASAVPTVSSGAGAVSGAGSIVLSAAQELESGITLSFGVTSRVATITGNIEIAAAGLADETIRFDLEKFLTAV